MVRAMNKLILDSVIEQAIKDCIESVSCGIASKYDRYGANDVYEIEYKSRDGLLVTITVVLFVML